MGPAALTLATYNIQHGRGSDGVQDLRRTARLLASLDADVIVVQEVERRAWRSGLVDQPRALGRLLGMEPAFCRARGLLAHDFGCAALSRSPIVERRCVKLPRPSGEQRVAVVIRVAVPDPSDSSGEATTTVWSVVGTHLGLDPDARIAQVRRLIEILDGLAPPVILAGDLNAYPGSPELAELEKWGRMAGPGDLATYPADRPDRHIDHVFAGPGCDIIRARTVSTLYSDHLPIVAAFSKQEQNGGKSEGGT
jgi:endonuclease/exonuclease/phosphatase family metal-dependent hydrolase